MRVLLLAAWPAFPLSHGGRMRVFRLASGLARVGAAVELRFPWTPGTSRKPFVRDGVVCHPELRATLPLLPLPEGVLPSALPTSWQRLLPSGRRALRDARGFDVVQVESPGYGSWLGRLQGPAARVYASHNVEADFARAAARTVARLERLAVRDSDLVLACTEADGHRFRGLYGDDVRFAVVPNGFDDALLDADVADLRDPARERLGLAHEERAVLFVGGGADHNRKAVRFLERDVLPALAPETRLLVAGRAAAALEGADPRRTLALGYVEDLAGLLAAADVAVNPVAYGSGSNLKMAEYMAAGLPVVTTPVGLRGFERWAGSMAVAELDGFATAIREAPGRGAPPEGIEELGWRRIAGALHEVYEGLL